MVATRKRSSTLSDLKTTKRFNKKHIILVVLVVLALIMLSTLAFLRVSHDRAVAAEKADFAKAEDDINALTQDVIAKLGEPLRRDNLNGCSKPNQKLDTGKLSCQVGTVLFYDSPDLQRSNKHLVWLLDDLHVYGFQEQNGKILFKKNLQIDDSNEMLVDSLGYTNNLKCKISATRYLSNLPPFSDFFSNQDNSTTLAIRITCSELALRHYYM